MRQHLIPIALSLVAVAAWAESPLACGDKFLAVNRGTRFQRAAPRRDASILLYGNPKSAMSQDISGLSMDATLKKAGYRPTTVATLEELQKAIARGGWDLVVANVADMNAVQAKMHGIAALAVLTGASDDEVKKAQRQYDGVLKTPTRTQAFLDAVDGALSAKHSPKSAGRGN